MAQVDKKHSQKIYYFDDATFAEQTQCQEVIYDYNHSRPSEIERRAKLLKQIFAEVGEDCMIEPPLQANWGKHTHLGDKVYANFNLTLVDDTHIYIGDYTMIGPNVTLATAGHPINPEPRKQAAQFNVPITIGRNVWIGANSVVLPGISIGENSVIGAGSVVTKDIPANVVAVGNPCKVLREISERDKQFYYKNLAFGDE
ncbi:sugar O-acetyltransferase [Agarivorans albus]